MLEAHCDQKNCRGLRPHANREGDGCGRGCTPQEILYAGNGGIGVTLLAEPIRNWTGAPCSHQRTWVENGGAQPLQRSLPCGAKGALAKVSILVHRAKA